MNRFFILAASTCALSFSVSCKPRNDSATKDALAGTGVNSADGTGLALFMNDTAKARICTVNCTDTGPNIVIPDAQGKWTDRLKCDIDMACMPTADFYNAYIKKSVSGPVDPLVASILSSGFTVQTGPEQGARSQEMAKYLADYIKSTGKTEPVSPDLADKYLVSTYDPKNMNHSSEPDEQKVYDDFAAKAKAAREANAKKVEDEKIAAAKAEHDKYIADKKADYAARIAKIKANLPKNAAVPGCSLTSNPSTSVSGSDGNKLGTGLVYTALDGEADCFYNMFNVGTSNRYTRYNFVRPSNLATRSVPTDNNFSHTGIGTEGFTITDSIAVISYTAEYGTDDTGFSAFVNTEDSIRMMEALRIAPNYGKYGWKISIPGLQKMTLAASRGNPPWIIQCALEGSDPKFDPYCHITVNRTLRYDRAKALADDKASYDGSVAEIAKLKATEKYDDKNPPYGPGERLGKVARPLRFVRNLDYNGRNLILNYNPPRNWAYWGIGLGPNCQAAFDAVGSLGAYGAASATTDSNSPVSWKERTPNFRKDNVKQIYVYGENHIASISYINWHAKLGAACNDLQFFAYP